MDEKQIPSLAEIHIASRHLRAIAVPTTPIITNGSLNRLTKKNIYLKCENFQRTGSFKTRGTLNVILNAMKIEPNLKGFVTCSSGNYGIAVSYAASLVKRPCVVVVSDDTPKYVITAIKQYGAEIITCKSSHQDICSRISKEREYFLVPSSAHPDVIAGYGTIAVELLEQIPDLDAIFVPVNEGDLISGIALYAKRINPNIRIYACIPEGKMLEECFTESKSSRFLQRKCQACCSQQCGMLTFPIMCSLIEKQVFIISDKVMIDATRFAFEHLKLVIELASGLSLGAILSQYDRLDSSVKNIAIILTGGNIDFDQILPWQQGN